MKHYGSVEVGLEPKGWHESFVHGHCQNQKPKYDSDMVQAAVVLPWRPGIRKRAAAERVR